MTRLAMAAAILGMITTTALAKPSLRSVERVENGLFSIVVADKIRKECSSISGRMVRAMTRMQNLADHAQDLGYSEREIRAYVNSDAEKARMKAKRDAYLANKGVVKSDPATYCAAGRVEIQNSTEIGALLRAR